MLSLQELTRTRTSPRVYCNDNMPGFWVAEGTDGALYAVPMQPGGWMCSEALPHLPGELRPLPDEEARSVVWFVYGDVGNVRIAER